MDQGLSVPRPRGKTPKGISAGSRGLMIFLAFILAAAATLAVYVYVQGVEDKATPSAGRFGVIVSDRDIPAGTALDDLISEGAFRTENVTADALVAGAVRDLTELQGRVTSAAVLAGEQLSTARLEGSNELPGGVLGIPAGYQALTIALDDPRSAGGAIARGDHVTLFATVGEQTGVDRTLTLVPDAEVLRVTGSSPLTDARGSESTAEGSIAVTLALKPKDVQKVILAQERASTYLALLPPNQAGKKLPPLNITSLR